jgi:hypothetical protein
MKRLFWCLTPLLLTSVGARASTIDSVVDRIDWSGELELGIDSNRDSAPAQNSPQEGMVRALLKPKVELNENYGLNMDLLFRSDSGNTTRNTVRVDEAYVTAKVARSTLTFRAGKIIYTWGNDAIYSPTDFLNPRDYYDLFHVDKLGVIALDANIAASDTLSFDLGMLPVFQSSIVSDSTSLWINYSPFVSQAVTSKLGLPANLPPGYSVPFDLQQRTPKLPQLFARMSLKTLRFDASLAYSYRYNPFPQVVLFSSNISFDAINGVPVGQVQGVPYYQHEHLLAFDANIPIFGSVFFMGSTLTLPDVVQTDIPSNTEISSNLNNVGLAGNVSASDIDNSRRSSVATVTLGMRKDWSHFHAYLQFARIWYLLGSTPASLLNQAVNSSGVNPSDVYDFFSGTLTPGIDWNLNSRLGLRLGAILNLKSTGVVTDSAIEYKILDGFKGSLAYSYITGSNGNLLSYYSGNSRLTLNLNMVF